METTGNNNPVHLSEEDLKITTNLTNTYYILIEAADMILRDVKSIFEYYDKSLNGKIKQRHNNIMHHARALENLIDGFIEDYEDFKGDWDKHTELRASAAYIVRVSLLIGDRAALSSAPLERDIEKFIYDLPPNGYAPDHILGRFRIK